MNKNDENEEYPLAFSIRLELMATTLELIANALSIWALIEAIEEEKIIEEEEEQEKYALDEQLEKMQAQIDQLTGELNELKKHRSHEE